MYLLLKGSHSEKHPDLVPIAQWVCTEIWLEPGDALFWRGDLFYFLSPNAGGKWLTLSKSSSINRKAKRSPIQAFPLPSAPNVVDLTEDQ